MHQGALIARLQFTGLNTDHQTLTLKQGLVAFHCTAFIPEQQRKGNQEHQKADEYALEAAPQTAAETLIRNFGKNVFNHFEPLVDQCIRTKIILPRPLECNLIYLLLGQARVYLYRCDYLLCLVHAAGDQGFPIQGHQTAMIHAGLGQIRQRDPGLVYRIKCLHPV